MRTGVPLHQIRKEVLIEAGFSTDVGHSVFSKERLDQMIARNERMMAREHEWPGIHFEEEVSVSANEQYVNMPDDINYTDIKTVHVAYGDDLLPVRYGIGARERSIYNSTQRATPIMRWEVVPPGTDEFEVWPIGNVAQTLLFSGQKSIGVFEDDSDTCTLDADVIVLRVAAEILGRDQKQDAGLKLEMAQRLTNNILKGQSATREQVNMGGVRMGRTLRPGIDFIPPGGG